MPPAILRFFTWWNGASLNTLWHTRRHGEKVGEDEFGNVYWRTRGGKLDPALGYERRWVIYRGLSEPSKTPPLWNAWLRGTLDAPPAAYAPRDWELPHRPNYTGTDQALRPPGSLARGGVRPPAGGDYEAWSPGA
ncbi:MAG: NADH:ubiquinone oxidoreductase subunit NDUFA12 [Hyphomicrobiales bacterium]|nr:NADH:ubiquinone oxidoreductase subunit NDUFA12 [Hyphomicrobiales bacterium]MDE2017162.1 NADH:ubiquinone oxidoreductase subunit NDUFA12 [Hyphomicrobiales bacterium]